MIVQTRLNASERTPEKLMPIMTVTAAIAGLKNTIDLTKAAIAARDEIKLAEMQQSINDRIIDVQNAALALQEKQAEARDEIDNLKEQIRAASAKTVELERVIAERAAYELHEVSHGVFAYISAAAGVPQHFICQPCYDGPDRRKAVLKYFPATQHTHAHYNCPACKNVLRV